MSLSYDVRREKKSVNYDCDYDSLMIVHFKIIVNCNDEFIIYV